MRAAKRKVMKPRVTGRGNPGETTRVETPAGVRAREHRPESGQGPQGSVGVMIPFGAAPPVPPPPVGAGKGYKGW